MNDTSDRVAQARPKWRLRPTPGQSGSMDLIHPNGGVAATFHDVDERLGAATLDLFVALQNDGLQEMFVSARAAIAEVDGQRRQAEQATRKLLDRIRPLEPFETFAAAFQSIVADALLWFDGYAAAFAHREEWERPRIPDREQLRELNAALQKLLPHRPHPADDTIPF